MSANPITEDCVATKPDDNLLYYFATDCTAKNANMKIFIDKMIANLSGLLTTTEMNILKVIRTSVHTRMHLITETQEAELYEIENDILTDRVSFEEGNRRSLEIVRSTQIYQQVNAFFSALFSRDINNYKTFIAGARQILTDDIFRDEGFVDFDFFPAM